METLQCPKGHSDTYYVNQKELEGFISNGLTGQKIKGLLSCNKCDSLDEITFEHVRIAK